MNAKRVKKIRASLRSNGVDWREAYYTGQSKRNWKTTVLDRNCGRAAYKWVKYGTDEVGAST